MQEGPPQLVDQIRERIQANHGWISFSEYMELALYSPGLGYYDAGAVKFGADGDFTTAPEISPLFGQCLAHKIAQLFRHIPNANILEFGAGTGRLAATILRTLSAINSLPKHYYILEVSAELRDRQKQHIRQLVPELASCVSWLDTLPDNPFNGVIIANEVLDAMPVKRFKVDKQGLVELGVGLQGNNFIWQSSPLTDPDLRRVLPQVLTPIKNQLFLPYCSEINVLLAPWTASIADCMGIGVMFCIDYGYSRAEYYHPQRVDGTLLCHYRHRAHSDPLILVGAQDITASVDFTALAMAADQAGMDILAYTTLAHFLLSCGLTDLIEQTAGRNATDHAQYLGAAKTFLVPGEMGEKFKTMVLAKGLADPVLDWGLLDLRLRL